MSKSTKNALTRSGDYSDEMVLCLVRHLEICAPRPKCRHLSSLHVRILTLVYTHTRVAITHNIRLLYKIVRIYIVAFVCSKCAVVGHSICTIESAVPRELTLLKLQ